jgi:hypothetical protein
MRHFFLAVAALLTAMVTSTQALAGRVVMFDILIDGQVVLAAGTLDQGERSPDQVWSELGSMPLYNPAKKFVLSATETERLNAFEKTLESMAKGDRLVLKGKIRIFCRYAGDVRTNSLTLIRKDAKSPWTIDPAEVERLAATRKVDPARRTRDQFDRDAGKKPSDPS